MTKPRVIAFYLPQYHPIPENDEWWGKGFTEWTNVAKAKPLFKGHYQPHLPADLGFYDLRVPEVREQQAQMARENGIDGFCYYHYWFNGKRLLERPFQEVLDSGKPDFPFCLCWANENWTRRWDGFDKEVLQEMTYSSEDDLNHIHALLPWFSDERYIKIDEKPILLVYRFNSLPNPLKTTTLWREEAVKAGFPGLYLCRVGNYQSDPSNHGFDAEVEFQPDWSFFRKRARRSLAWRLLMKLGLASDTFKHNRVIKYKTMINQALKNLEPSFLKYPCVTPSWDNTPRRKEYRHIVIDSSPQAYQEWLTETVRRHKNKDFIFINAWNEWGESNHLEPDQRYGYAYLLATRNAINSALDLEKQEISEDPGTTTLSN